MKILSHLFLLFALILLPAHARAIEASLKLASVDSSTYVEPGDSGFNVRFCFKDFSISDGSFMTRSNFPTNCARLKAGFYKNNPQSNAIIFETRKMSIKFKTRDLDGSNYKMWLRSSSGDDTQNFTSFLRQFDKAQQAVFGTICTKLQDRNFLDAQIKSANQRASSLDNGVVRRVNKDAALKDWSNIASRCVRTVERMSGPITLKIEQGSKTTKDDSNRDVICGYVSGSELTSALRKKEIQRGLARRGLYDGKIDGVMGKGSCAGFQKFMNCGEVLDPNKGFLAKDLITLRKDPPSSVRACYGLKPACNMTQRQIVSAQEALIKLKNYRGPINGKLDNATLSSFASLENNLFGKVDGNQKCLSVKELSWLEVLVYGIENGSECTGFNSAEELARIIPNLQLLGYLKSSNDNTKLESVQRLVVRAIIRYEQEVSDDFFSGRGRARDCKITPVEYDALTEATTPKPVSVYSLEEAKHFLGDLKIYLDNCDNYFGAALADKAGPLLDLPSSNSWDTNDKKNFEALKDFTLNSQPEDGTAFSCKIEEYGNVNINSFNSFHKTRKLNRKKSLDFAIDTLQSEIKGLISAGEGFREANPFSPSASNVKNLVILLNQSVQLQDVFALLDVINIVRTKYNSLGVTYVKNKISLVSTDFLMNEKQLLMSNLLAELNEEITNRTLENEVALRETQVAAAEELDEKKARFIDEAPMLFEDIREFYALGKNLGIDLAVYINKTRGAEKSQNWSDNLVEDFEKLLSYVNQFEEFTSFRVDQKRKREDIANKLRSDLLKDIERVVTEIERFAAVNPFANSSYVLATLVREIGETPEETSNEELEKTLNKILNIIASEGVDLPLSELLARRGYAVDGANQPIDTPKDVITILSDAQRYILDIRDFTTENPDAFGFELVRLYRSVSPILDEDRWDDGAKSSFRNLQKYVLNNQDFVQFRYTKLVKRQKELEETLGRLKELLSCYRSAGESYIKLNVFEKDTTRVFDALDYASRFETSTKVEDYLSLIARLKILFANESVESNCNNPIEIAVLELDDEQRKLLELINNNKAEEEAARKAEEEAKRKAAEEAALKAEEEAKLVLLADEARLRSKALLEDIQSYLDAGGTFNLEFATRFRDINDFLEKDVWTIEEFKKFADFEKFCFSFEKFANFQNTREVEIIAKLNSRLNELTSETSLVLAELSRWLSANPLNENAITVLDTFQGFENCPKPKPIVDRLKVDGLTSFENCVYDLVQQLPLFDENGPKFCGKIFKLGNQCSSPTPTSAPLSTFSLSEAQLFLSDLQEYIGTNNDSCIRTSQFAALAAAGRPILGGVWTEAEKEVFAKLRELTLSCSDFSAWFQRLEEKRIIEENTKRQKICAQIKVLLDDVDQWVLSNPFNERAFDALSLLDNMKAFRCDEYKSSDLQKTLVNFSQKWSTVNPGYLNPPTIPSGNDDNDNDNFKTSDDQFLGQIDAEWKSVISFVSVKEQRFCSIVKESEIDLEEALSSGNQLKQNRILRDRDDDIEALLPEGKFSDWLAKVEEVYATPEGDAGFLLSMPCDFTIGTGVTKDGTSGQRWHASAKPGSAIYNQLLDLSRGDFVIVSGGFLTYAEEGLSSSGQRFITIFNNEVASQMTVGNKQSRAPDYLAKITYLSKL